MTRTRTDIQLEAAGLLLVSIGSRLPIAKATLTREMSVADGSPARTLGDGTSRGSAELTSVERAAELRWKFSNDIEDLETKRAIIIELVNDLSQQTNRALGTRAPAADAPRCRDAQHGREGAIEWGDTTCEELGVKTGMCGACYQRERRWRIAKQLPERDAIPAA